MNILKQQNEQNVPKLGDNSTTASHPQFNKQFFLTAANQSINSEVSSLLQFGLFGVHGENQLAQRNCNQANTKN